jgi:solute carrier family 9 (sodium/hydrogen exchanger), member 10/11
MFILGYGISLKELAFLSWSGLRGAVGLALALVIQQLADKHKLVISEEEGSRLLFIVGGVVTLTLVINATGAQRILYALGLVDDDSEEIHIMQNYAR